MDVFACRLIACAAAGVLDQIFGDPRRGHPVCLVGRLIGWTEKWTRPLFPKTRGGARAGGVYLVVFVLLAVVSAAAALTVGAYRIHPVCGAAAESLLIYYALAEKSLERESYAVYRALHVHGLQEARRAVSMIVGRDTESLDEKGVIRAAVETVAENTSDGVIAPLLFAFLGGAPLAWFYKAVNTMDSMVGYRNEVYRDYGTAAARLDDAANFIPARLSAVFMLAVLALARPLWAVKAKWRGRHAGKPRALFLEEELQKRSLREIFTVYRKYRRSHASPNSAQTESVMAGALGVELAGPASYFGEIHPKPVIGERTREVEREDILRSMLLLRGTSCLFWVCGVLVTALLWRFAG